MTRVGFEPTPQGDCDSLSRYPRKEPEHSALDHSAILPHYAKVGETSNYNVRQNVVNAVVLVQRAIVLLCSLGISYST